MTNFIVVTIFCAVIAGFAWAVIKGREIQRRREGERKALARSMGWAYAGERDGDVDYRFDGDAGGIAWRMWYDPDRGDKSPTPRAHWHSDNLRTPRLSLVVLGRKRYELESGAVGRVLMGVVAGVAEMVTGSVGKVDKTEFYDGAVEVAGLLPSFRERFAVAVAPDMPRDWVDAPLQSLLLRWPGDGSGRFSSQDAVEITLSERGLRITVQRMPQEADCWRHLAKLGEHVAQRLVRAGAPEAGAPPRTTRTSRAAA